MKVGFSADFSAYHEGKKYGVVKGEKRLSVLGAYVYLGNGMEKIPIPARFVPVHRNAVFSLGGKKYRGQLVVRRDTKRRLIAINEVPVETYLCGVVPHEIGKRGKKHFEALKVQAVAARTYTYSRLNRNAADGFDVYSDVSDQVYDGMKSEYSLASAAVDATRDVVITHDDALISAYYFSTTSGATANVEEVWPDKGYKPYLRSVSDSVFNTTSKYFFWKETWNGGDLERIANRYLPESVKDFKRGRLKDIFVKSYTSSGRVKTLVFVIGGRSYQVHGDRVRWALRRDESGFPILRSSWFRLDVKKGVSGVKKVTATGRGYGHGVGMSQIGALQMAAAGKRYDIIIKYYYTGVELNKVTY